MTDKRIAILDGNGFLQRVWNVPASQLNGYRARIYALKQSRPKLSMNKDAATDNFLNEALKIRWQA
jgi:hypothetical protein